MAIGDGSSGEGATRHVWDPDVKLVVQRLHRRFSAVTTNTYECHPFCGPPGNRQGWARRSIDVWGSGGRGDALARDLCRSVADFLFDMPGEPLIRHLILGDRIWVRGLGWGAWTGGGHTGALRHVHVTYQPVPRIG